MLTEIQWSPHAKEQFMNILAEIGQALSPEDAFRWRQTILSHISTLADFPKIGMRIPKACFLTVPDNASALRQTFCKPYRIVYEHVGNKINILSLHHCRMLVHESDTFWTD